jgi:hypothetical protein
VSLSATSEPSHKTVDGATRERYCDLNAVVEKCERQVLDVGFDAAIVGGIAGRDLQDAQPGGAHRRFGASAFSNSAS